MRGRGVQCGGRRLAGYAAGRTSWEACDGAARCPRLRCPRVARSRGGGPHQAASTHVPSRRQTSPATTYWRPPRAHPYLRASARRLPLPWWQPCAARGPGRAGGGGAGGSMGYTRHHLVGDSRAGRLCLSINQPSPTDIAKRPSSPTTTTHNPTKTRPKLSPTHPPTHPEPAHPPAPPPAPCKSRRATGQRRGGRCDGGGAPPGGTACW